MSWKVVYTRQAVKDAKKLSQANLAKKTQQLIELISQNPYHSSPPFEKLVGNLSGVISRRINIQHRLIYQVYPQQKTIKIIRMWSHYE